ncbi:MAG: flippase-like domain-containing protein [Sphaerospermopsis sp. SIO1G2]|nr:flippase-like domain-containing protein [Sphaerospermopsis sp. SIO1G2]
MKLKAKKIITTAISIGFLVVLFRMVDFQKIYQQLQNLSGTFIIFALIYYAFCQLLSCVRWQLILKAYGHQTSIKVLLSSYFAGMFLNTFLPSSVGGDMYRVYVATRTNQNMEASFASVFIERITGIFALLGIAFFSLPAAVQWMKNWNIIWLLLGCTALLSVAVLLTISPRVLMLIKPWLIQLKADNFVDKFTRIQIILRNFVHYRKYLAISLFLSFLLQLMIIYYYYLVSQQLNIPILYWQLLVFVPIVVVVTLLPISLGGLGIKEGVLAYLFIQINLSVEQAVLLSLTVMTLGIILSLPGGVILLFDSVNNLRDAVNIKKKLEESGFK